MIADAQTTQGGEMSDLERLLAMLRAWNKDAVGDPLSAEKDGLRENAIATLTRLGIKIGDMRLECDALVAALTKCRAYFAERMDADQEITDASPQPNTEMALVVLIDAALAKAGAK
jgi:hypothetical protein